MSEHYKYFQNNKCEYFPCHTTKEIESFNCLFCFCPLYLLKDECGGDFRYKNNIKDCSNCMIPHSEKGYDYLMSKMKKVIELGSKREAE